MKRRIALYTLSAILLLLMEGSVSGQSDDRTRVFNAPVDRVWVVASSTLKSLGWSVDKEDRDVGWIRTDSRRLEGGDYGVYSKGAKHRLRVVIKAQNGSRTAVTVERRVWKEERILWMDKEEELPTTDHSVETQLLDAVGKSL